MSRRRMRAVCRAAYAARRERRESRLPALPVGTVLPSPADGPRTAAEPAVGGSARGQSRRMPLSRLFAGHNNSSGAQAPSPLVTSKTSSIQIIENPFYKKLLYKKRRALEAV